CKEKASFFLIVFFNLLILCQKLLIQRYNCKEKASFFLIVFFNLLIVCQKLLIERYNIAPELF
ncbi:hypothetical protein X973_08710, partial [Piscirickettsia salmonis]